MFAICKYTHIFAPTTTTTTTTTTMIASKIQAKVFKILTSWVIGNEIDDTECARLLTGNGLENEQASYLMDCVNTSRVVELGVEKIIIDDLDQSTEYNKDCFKQDLAEKLDIEYDNEFYDENPMQDYLRYDSGV